MQTMLKIVDLGAMGNMAAVNTQKIAIRMNSDGNPISTQDEAGFMECLRQFLSKADDQVKSSLEQLEWISLEGGEGGMAPVIDFTSDDRPTLSALEALIRSIYGLDPDDDLDPDPSGEQRLPVDGWPPVPPEIEGLLENAVAGTGEQTPASSGATAGDRLQSLVQDPSGPAANIDVVSENDTGLPPDPSMADTEKEPGADMAKTIGAKAKAHPAPALADGKLEPDPTRAMPSERDVPLQKSDTENPELEIPEEELALKTIGTPRGPKQPQGAPSGQSTATLQTAAIDKEKEIAPQPQRSDKEEASTFQRMFAERSSNGQEPSMSFQQGTADGGSHDHQGYSPRESQPTGETQMTPVSAKSVDSAPTAESNSTQGSPKTLESDVIRQIVQRMTLRNSGDRSSMTIKLKPEFLGNLKMDITTDHQHVVVRMTAESSTVKEMIEHNIGVLKTELQQHGLNIDKFDVTVGQENESWKQRQQETASRQGRRGNMRSFNSIDSPDEDTDRPLASTLNAAAGTGKSRSGEIDFFA